MKRKRNVSGKKIGLSLSVFHLVVYLLLGLFPQIFADNDPPDSRLFPPVVPYNAAEIAIDDVYQPPTFELDRHFLGTDNLGRDVLAGIIYGAQTSLMVSVPAMLIAAFIGIMLGMLGGYFGNQQIKMSKITLFALATALLFGVYYGFYLPQFSIKLAFEKNFLSGLLHIAVSALIIICFVTLALTISHIIIKRTNRQKTLSVPVDEIVLKLTELFASIPRLILIIALAAFFRPTLGLFVIIIGFTSWTGMARLVRGEIKKVKAYQFVEAGRALGLTSSQILFKHILPNAIPPAIVAFTFGLANLLALEATLSFLGIGLPPDFISWGKIIAGIRYNLSAWWMVVFPGLYLSLTVLALHNCSNYFLDKFGR